LPPQRLLLQHRAEPAAAVDLRQRAAGYAETVGAIADDVRIAVNEAVCNVIYHAYRGRDAGRLELELVRDGDRLCVFVRDEGCGPVPNPESPGGGLGLVLIAGVTEEHELRTRAEGGTELWMSFPLSERAAGRATAC
jgi:two-component sensor histidine kinase